MKLISLIGTIFLILSCSSNNDLRKIIINNDDYWAWYDEAEPGFHEVYVKFNSNGKSDQYCKDSDTLRIVKGGDLIATDTPWTITPDSVLKWRGNNLYIVSYSNDA